MEKKTNSPKMDYQRAAAEALKGWNAYRKNPAVKEIAKDSQFRKLTVYESSGNASALDYCLFGLEFCDKDGTNYKEIMIAVYVKDGAILQDVRLYTISNI